MNKKTSKKEEFDHFSEIAKEWWEPDGKFKILHKILPLRIEYILKNINKNKVRNFDILDLGCGGGLTCEPLSRLGAKVTGVDFIKKNIEVAKTHAIKSNLKIRYIYNDLDSFNLKEKFDVILILEVLEHLDQWEILLKKIKNNLKKKGVLIISTINQTQLARIFAIYMAENILNWIPKNTHNFQKLIKPNILKKTLEKNNFVIKSIEGLNYNPIFNEWFLNKNYYPINYFCAAKLV